MYAKAGFLRGWVFSKGECVGEEADIKVQSGVYRDASVIRV